MMISRLRGGRHSRILTPVVVLVALNIFHVAQSFRTQVKQGEHQRAISAVGTRSDVQKARDALEAVSRARDMSIRVATRDDVMFFRNEAERCKFDDCCICSGDLLEISDPDDDEPAPIAVEILTEAADALEDDTASGDEQDLIVVAENDEPYNSVSAFAWVQKKTDRANELYVSWLCQRPLVRFFNKTLACKDAKEKSGQLAFAKSLVEGSEKFAAVTARLAVAGTHGLEGSKFNYAAHGLYCKYCFQPEKPSYRSNIAMKNADLPGLVKKIPQLIAGLMPGAERNRSEPLCKCTEHELSELVAHATGHGTGPHSVFVAPAVTSESTNNGTDDDAYFDMLLDYA